MDDIIEIILYVVGITIILVIRSLGQKKKTTTLSLSVGHVNTSGSDYHSITGTSVTLTKRSSKTYSTSLGSGSAVECTTENTRRLVYTITQTDGNGKVELKYNTGSSPSSISTPAIMVPDISLILGVPLFATYYYLKKRKKAKSKTKK